MAKIFTSGAMQEIIAAASLKTTLRTQMSLRTPPWGLISTKQECTHCLHRAFKYSTVAIRVVVAASLDAPDAQIANEYVVV